MKTLVCGGDIRQIYMANALRERGYDVDLTLFDKAATADDLQNSRRAIRACDVLILPLPVSRSGKTVNAPLSDNPIPVSGIASLLHAPQQVFGGMIPFALAEELQEKNIPYYDYYKDENLITRNAIPTAEGVLGILIREIPVTVHTARCLITGYGRCGSATAELLMQNGAKVTVAARSKEALAKAAAQGCGTVPIDRLADTQLHYDALINTVPYRILTEPVLKKLHKDTVLIEIASAPFGIDFDCAEDLKLKVIKAGSLPGIVSPKTAGIIIADSIDAALTGRKGEYK